MSEADEVKRPKGSTSTKKSPDIALSDTSLKQSRTRGYPGTRFAEGLGILTLHLVTTRATAQEFAWEFR